ncbi:hypothetical protein [Verrucomicrobium spinosum]|uniref:hypothetical protein n=1 Tax=Verrucomicrobium spinosum TaxID=2736 RepID=UPI0012F68E54|nr:hypothetical protein [Verrucomicrobium spinosum]
MSLPPFTELGTQHSYSSGSWLVDFDDLMVSQSGLPNAGGIKVIRRLKERRD